MWPNNNFVVFEIKWSLGYELWVLSLSYEFWVLDYENWVIVKPNEPLIIPCFWLTEIERGKGANGTELRGYEPQK